MSPDNEVFFSGSLLPAKYDLKGDFVFLNTDSKNLVIVPAYNEEHSIESVIHNLAGSGKYDIVVINDGSVDNTSERARKTGKAAVIDLPINSGIGAAVQTGFMYAMNEGYEYALQFDGDGQHLVDEIEKILRPLINKQADVVIGSRFLLAGEGYKSSFARRLGIRIFKYMTRVLIRQTITDCTSGFRAYNRQAIIFLADNYPEDFPEPEAVILLGKNNFYIREIPVKMKHREAGQSSIGGLKSFYYMIKVILAMTIASFRKPLKQMENQ